MSDIEQPIDACLFGNQKMVTILLIGGTNVNGGDSVGTTPLGAAMANGQTSIVRSLLASKHIMLDGVNSWDNTGLHGACWKNSSDCVKLFLAHPS
jgi:ankyrin repeat protein